MQIAYKCVWHILNARQRLPVKLRVLEHMRSKVHAAQRNPSRQKMGEAEHKKSPRGEIEPLGIWVRLDWVALLSHLCCDCLGWGAAMKML